MTIIHTFLTEQFDTIINQWQARLTESFDQRQQQMSSSNLTSHCSSLLRGFISSVTEHDNQQATEDLADLLGEVGSIWARRGMSASETSNFIITLKQTLIELARKRSPEASQETFTMLLTLESQLDQLLLTCHEAYTSSREKLIRQQSAALLELSSPVVKMWDHTLLMPLIGVIDTSRAKQIAESLLTEISKQAATVAVMDLTGVPIFDTAVAGHLIKTINAAHMLGCKIVMTGISAEGALVLTKLGIEFKDVITRGNLHSGVKTALGLQGLSVQSQQVA